METIINLQATNLKPRKIRIGQLESAKWGVYFDEEDKPAKEFDEFQEADMWKEQYFVDHNIDVGDITNELLKNINIKIPEYVTLEKYSKFSIEENTLTIFAAKPGNGKTLFLIDFMRECLQASYKSIFFSLEMSKEAIRKRYKDDDLVFNSENIILKDRTEMTLTNLETTLKYYLKSSFGKPDFIFIDYIQYLSTDDRELKRFASHIKILAKKYKIRFVCAAQLNANFSIDKPNDIVDAMSGSREISKTSEMIILVYKHDGIFNLEVVKNRNGENGPDTHMYFLLNKENGVLDKYKDFEKDLDNVNVTREIIIAHELGHNFIQYILSKKVSPICITEWGGYILAKKMSAVNELKVLYAGVILENILIPDFSAQGHGSDLAMIDRIMKGIYLRENLYISFDLSDDKENKKFTQFKSKYLAPIVSSVETGLKENISRLKNIWDQLCADNNKNLYKSEEVKQLFDQEKNWKTESLI